MDESPTLKLSLELGDSPESLRALQDLLTTVVQAAGGQAGVIATVGNGSAVYGLDETTSQALAPILEQAARGVSQHGTNPGLLQRVQEEVRRAGNLTDNLVTIPVRTQGQTIGLFCLVHPDDAPRLLKESPGVYNLRIDKLELVMENARLLERLLRERRWLEAVVKHSSDGVVILDREGLVVGYNQTIARLSGWEEGEAVGMPGHEAFPVSLDPLNVSSTMALRPVSQSFVYQTTAPVEGRLLTRDSQLVDVEMSGAALWAEDGTSLGWVMTLRDIRVRKETERLQKIFLSAVSHELHTPIAIIKGFAGLLSDPEMKWTPEQARDKAGIILEESRRLEEMVEQMLYATRIQAGKILLQNETVALDRLLKRTLQKLEPMAEQAGVTLSLFLPNEVPPVTGDPERLQQVVINLVENAFKYAPKGQVEVAVHVQEREVLVEVTDSGPGVKEEDKERIFTPFERGAEHLNTRIRGTGLGLYICKAIVEAHGGRIGVESLPNGGRFFFTIPREEYRR